MLRTSPKKKKIAVVRGGPSHAYHASLDTGAHVLMSLETLYDTKDILIDRDSRWIVGGKYSKPENALWDVDGVFNALHGRYGEDGTIQDILEAHSKPYTGSDSFSSFSSLNKHTAKKFFKAHGLKTPFYKIVKKDDVDIEEIALSLFSSFPLPLIVKPLHGEGSRGITLVMSFNDLKEALQEGFTFDESLIVEEYIKGSVFSCGVIEGYRDSTFYTTLPVEFHIPEDSLLINSRRELSLEYSVPAHLRGLENDEIQRLARLAHSILGLRHYSQSDFIISPQRGIFLIETNALPYLGIRSPFAASLDAVGSSREEFIHHVVTHILT